MDCHIWTTVTWVNVGNRIAAGVDLLTIQRLGGWKTLPMVQRYAHLAPGHLAAAVERIGDAGDKTSGDVDSAAPVGAVELRRPRRG